MTKIMSIIALLLGCRLLWIWVDLCGPDLGMGETLPFCLECSGFVSVFRLLILGVAIMNINKTLKSPPEETQLLQRSVNQVQTVRIHWHRIFLLFGIISYPIWIYWIDKNTAIPGPDAIIIFQASCKYAGFKGTVLWGIQMLFVTAGFKILYEEK